ncbi:hypothetical protein BDY21DRAFT_13071 [Lineolata rhizophorae]|uniref:Uncharacterized protein n=1 Tax=Lineolata rhizophorae TaxID=578093 RepID=A0A6A6PF34_9PEZI|nr:hypothetical protein BDY21DRAFT_13071 [Lineolata rhizophorae]
MAPVSATEGGPFKEAAIYYSYSSNENSEIVFVGPRFKVGFRYPCGRSPCLYKPPLGAPEHGPLEICQRSSTQGYMQSQKHVMIVDPNCVVLRKAKSDGELFSRAFPLDEQCSGRKRRSQQVAAKPNDKRRWRPHALGSKEKSVTLCPRRGALVATLGRSGLQVIVSNSAQ